MGRGDSCSPRDVVESNGMMDGDSGFCSFCGDNNVGLVMTS